MIPAVTFATFVFSDLRTCVHGKDMESYSETISGASVSSEMVTMISGIFRMGNPAFEGGLRPGQRRTGSVDVDASWMKEFEGTWQVYDVFIYADPVGERAARPTRLFVDMSFGIGKDGWKAMHIAQHAALPYRKGLTRTQSQPEWKQRDPPIPKGQWRVTGAPSVGFRIIRRVKRPTIDRINDCFYQPLPDY